MVKIRHRFPSYPGAIYALNGLPTEYFKFYKNGSIGIVADILSWIQR